MQHDDWGLLSEVVPLTFQWGQFNPGEFSKADLAKSVAMPDVSKGQIGQTTFDIQECPKNTIVAWLFLKPGPKGVTRKFSLHILCCGLASQVAVRFLGTIAFHSMSSVGSPSDL